MASAATLCWCFISPPPTLAAVHVAVIDPLSFRFAVGFRLPGRRRRDRLQWLVTGPVSWRIVPIVTLPVTHGPWQTPIRVMTGEFLRVFRRGGMAERSMAVVLNESARDSAGAVRRAASLNESIIYSHVTGYRSAALSPRYHKAS